MRHYQSSSRVDYDKLFNYTNPTTLREPVAAMKVFPGNSENFGRTFSWQLIRPRGNKKNIFTDAPGSRVYKLFIINLINFSVENLAVSRQQQIRAHCSAGLGGIPRTEVDRFAFKKVLSSLISYVS